MEQIIHGVAEKTANQSKAYVWLPDKHNILTSKKLGS